jgi:phospholipid N-methyltransferase
MNGSVVTDAYGFFRAWLSSPLRVAAVTPSSKGLAAAMTAEIDPSQGPVIELGPGTGVFTRALLDRGVSERDLALVECGQEFGHLLAVRFPQAETHVADAANLRHMILFGGIPAGAVVSGLPLLGMPPGKTLAILAAAFSKLRVGGAFYQFTYGPGCPVRTSVLRRLGLTATRIGFVLGNLPPASVYRIERLAKPTIPT